MKIEAGKVYVRRDDRVTGPLVKEAGDHAYDVYLFYDPVHDQHYNVEGEWLIAETNDEDLVREHVATVAEAPSPVEGAREAMAREIFIKLSSGGTTSHVYLMEYLAQSKRAAELFYPNKDGDI